MKGLALETIVKWVILLALAVIVINLILFFSDEIKRFIERQFGAKEWKTEKIEAKEFSPGQLIAYIKACWDRTGENFHEDAVCFILKGDVSKVDPNFLKTSITPPPNVDVSNFNNTRNVTIIRFEDLGNVVVVES
jgi:hypothetical protein